MSEQHELDRRLAVLEQIARDTAGALADIRAELRLTRTELRTELQGLRTELQGIRSDQRGDFRWLLRAMIAGFVGLAAIMAHGFHWF